MFSCTHCGGQNGLHFSFCPGHADGPRVHAAMRQSLDVGSKPGPLPYMHNSPTGRQNMSDPQMQNLPGTLAHALEMAEAKRGPVIFEGLRAEPYEPAPVIARGYSGSQQAADPSEPHRSMPAMSAPTSQPPLTFDQINTESLYTHRIKGGRYKVMAILTPAGDSARQVGTVIGYHDIYRPRAEGYWRSMIDFCQSMDIVAFVPQDN